MYSYLSVLLVALSCGLRVEKHLVLKRCIRALKGLIISTVIVGLISTMNLQVYSYLTLNPKPQTLNPRPQRIRKPADQDRRGGLGGRGPFTDELFSQSSPGLSPAPEHIRRRKEEEEEEEEEE